MADKLLIVDFDGTIFSTDECSILAAKEILNKKLTMEGIRKLPKPLKSKIYGLAFSKYNHKSIPNKKMIRILSKNRNSRIIILTARKNDHVKYQKTVLAKNNVPDHKRISSTPSEFEMHDEEWKARKIKKLIANYRDIELYEDKKENIVHIMSNVRSIKLKSFIVSKNSVKRF